MNNLAIQLKWNPDSIYEQEPMNGKKGRHVVPAGGKWKVRRTGSSRASGIFNTQKEALKRAKDLARSEGGEVYIFGRDGRLHSHMDLPHPKA